LAIKSLKLYKFKQPAM